jgi:hypothetical protein
LTQVDNAPELWRDQMQASLQALEAGHRLHPQYASRPAGVLVGLHSALGFGGRPSFDEIAHLPLAERVAELRTPARKKRILGERARSTSDFIDRMRSQFDRMYVLGDPVDYEPGPEMSIATMARSEGVDLESKFYDLLLGDEGRAPVALPGAQLQPRQRGRHLRDDATPSRHPRVERRRCSLRRDLRRFATDVDVDALGPRPRARPAYLARIRIRKQTSDTAGALTASPTGARSRSARRPTST